MGALKAETAACWTTGNEAFPRQESIDNDLEPNCCVALPKVWPCCTSATFIGIFRDVATHAAQQTFVPAFPHLACLAKFRCPPCMSMFERGCIMSEARYDFLVIGSGPAGVHAAIQACKMGKKVALIEKKSKLLGGAWLQDGTIPSKTMREVLAAVSNLRFHINKEWTERLQHNVSSHGVLPRAKEVSSQQEGVVRKFLTRNNVELIHGMLLSRRSAVCVLPALTVFRSCMQIVF